VYLESNLVKDCQQEKCSKEVSYRNEMCVLCPIYMFMPKGNFLAFKICNCFQFNFIILCFIATISAEFSVFVIIFLFI
jgi:hypothetical protein